MIDVTLMTSGKNWIDSSPPNHCTWELQGWKKIIVMHLHMCNGPIVALVNITREAFTYIGLYLLHQLRLMMIASLCKKKESLHVLIHIYINIHTHIHTSRGEKRREWARQLETKYTTCVCVDCFVP